MTELDQLKVIPRAAFRRAAGLTELQESHLQEAGLIKPVDVGSRQQAYSFAELQRAAEAMSGAASAESAGDSRY